MALLTEATKDEQLAEASLDRVLAALASEDISFIQLGSGEDPEVDIGHEALIRGWRCLCGEDRQFKTGWLVEEREDGRRIVSGSWDSTLRICDAGLFTASLQELVEKAEKLCPLSLEERKQLRLVDSQAEAAQKPLTPDQRRACGE